MKIALGGLWPVECFGWLLRKTGRGAHALGIEIELWALKRRQRLNS